MRGSNVSRGIIVFAFLSVASSCPSPQRKTISSDTPKLIIPQQQLQADNEEHKIYLKANAIYSGSVYTNKENKDVFYRIVEIPEEENIALIAENISIGEEGGNYQLIKRIRLTDNNSLMPKFGLNKADSIKFIDSVRVEGYFNGKKMIINLDSIKRI